MLPLRVTPALAADATLLSNDLASVAGDEPTASGRPSERERLSDAECERLVSQLACATGSSDAAQRLANMRQLYEPFLGALADYFCLRLPRFFPDQSRPDKWQTSAWTERAPGITELTGGSTTASEHFG